MVPPGGLKIGGEEIRRVEGARFLGVWVDEGLKWTAHIENVRAKVGRLLGVLGRAWGILGGSMVRSLYNALVLPHLQYCLIVWGDFEEGRNKVLGENLLRHQKRLVGMMAGQSGSFHSDPVFSQLGILKIDDLYKQQLRVYGWRSMKNRLPESQAAMLSKVCQIHTHNTRSAGTGLFVSTSDHRGVGYRIPKEWKSLSQKLKETNSLSGFKRRSREEFIARYRSFKCDKKDCYVCSLVRCRNAVHING